MDTVVSGCGSLGYLHVNVMRSFRTISLYTPVTVGFPHLPVSGPPHTVMRYSPPTRTSAVASATLDTGANHRAINSGFVHASKHFSRGALMTLVSRRRSLSRIIFSFLSRLQDGLNGV